MVDEGAARQQLRPARPASGGRRVVFILGMHRSGTSMLARLLAAEGLPLGERLLRRRSPDNRHGYWEQAEIVAIHEALLDGFDRTWHGPNGARPLPEGWLESPRAIAARGALAAILTRELDGAGGLWGFKDPRSLRFLPLWRMILADCGAAPVFILAARSPGAVAASLMRRNRLSRTFAEALWAANTVTLLEEVGGDLAAVVDYDRWFAAPGETLAHLRRVIGLARADRAGDVNAALIDPALRHHGGAAGREPPAADAAFEGLHDVLVAEAPRPPGVAALRLPVARARARLASPSEA